VHLLAKMHEFGKPAWIAATVLGFMLWWPVGLAVLGYTLFSGRVPAWNQRSPGVWYNTAMTKSGCGWGRRSAYAPSGNAAFDEYRAETLRRLEEEQKEFVDYLERLRRAKDKAEFDQFMAERRSAGKASDQTDVV
jgi:Protein of unknown function (DUF2852)